MEKADSLREVSKQETMDRDIFAIIAIIFDKLNLMGIHAPAPLGSLPLTTKSIWNTIDLAKLQQKGRPILFYKHQVDNEEYEEIPLTNKNNTFWHLYDAHAVEKGISLRKLLTICSNFHSYIKENDLMFAAERLKNIEKLALPIWFDSPEESCRFAFSQWKNLKTLIIVHDSNLTKTIFEFRIVGENCKNLTNLKYLGTFQVYYAKEIVCYLQSLERLSLRCSSVCIEGVLWLMKHLENLTILNLSHCKELDMSSDIDMNPKMVHDYNDYLVQAATKA